VELRTNPDRVRQVETAAPAAPEPTPAPAPKRTHTVQFGDTLEKIAEKYYHDPKQWIRIYTANSAKLRESGGAINPGMELAIPEQ
jgi:nucleoid-associated protein YgaU